MKASSIERSRHIKSSEEVRRYFRSNPMGFAAYRAMNIQVDDATLSDEGEIPYVTEPYFVVLLSLYLLWRRLVHVGRTRAHPSRGAEAVPRSGHVFTMSSTYKYRTHSFLEVASGLDELGHEVLMLCSPDAMANAEELDARDLSYRSHTSLHGRVGLLRYVRAAFDSAATVRRVHRLLPLDASFRERVVAFNYVLVEQVKRESTRTVFEERPSIHTYSPMPYIVESTDPDRIFVYQHGIQWAETEDRILMAAPFYVPLTYLVWGAVWRASFERAAHPDSTIIPVGSPWHDHLASARKESVEPRFDVLFISGTHGLIDEELEQRYDALFGSIVDVCEANGWSLAVKLHPVEDIDWYERRGWDNYVVEFDDIDEAIVDTRLAVTGVSSAFVESALMGTPVVFADTLDIGLRELGPVENVVFPGDLDEVPGLIVDILDGDNGQREGDPPKIVEIGDATGRIIRTVTERVSRTTDPDVAGKSSDSS